MAIPTRLGAIALLSLALAGCAAGLLPALVAPQAIATLGVATLSAVDCASGSSCEPQPQRCVDAAGKRIEVTEAAVAAVPADEGKVVAFTPAYWESPFETQGTARSGRPVAPLPGTLAVTDRSAVYVPPAGSEGVHIPLAGVVNVETQRNATTFAPRQITVESCYGRLDRFTFGQKDQPGRLDSDATLAAADEILARIAALRGPPKNKGEGSR